LRNSFDFPPLEGILHARGTESAQTKKELRRTYCTHALSLISKCIKTLLFDISPVAFILVLAMITNLTEKYLLEHFVVRVMIFYLVTQTVGIFEV
jgi:hypothetical protein